MSLRAVPCLLAAVAVYGTSCGPWQRLFPPNASEQTSAPQQDFTPPPLGDPDLLSMLPHDCDDHRAPWTVMDEAFDIALSLVDEIQPSDASASYDVPANPRNDASTEAWTRIERALIVAEVDATPSPPAANVSVEQQLLATSQRQVPPGYLHLRVVNTGESHQIQLYGVDGRMRSRGIIEAAVALRDSRSDRIRTIHPRTLAMLYMVGQHYDSTLTVVSGYRVRGVNATEGSRHGSGEAVDFMISGVGTLTLARFLDTHFENVGVGYYPTSSFVHLDRRDRSYYWIDRSGPGQRSRVRTRSAYQTSSRAPDITLRSVHLTEEELYQVPPQWRDAGY